MANVTIGTGFGQPFDIPDDVTIGDLHYLTPVSWSPSYFLGDYRLLGRPSLRVEFIGQGFNYEAGGVPAGGGTVTTIRETSPLGLVLEISDVAIPVSTLKHWSYYGLQYTAVQTALASNDSITGSSHGERISAYGGHDIVAAGSGHDTVSGNDGDDLLMGQDGNDVLWGDAGDDDLFGGFGNDGLYGGTGIDSAVTAALRREAVVSGNPLSSGTLICWEGTEALSSIETIRFVDGALHYSTVSAAPQAMRLYLAALGRAPDVFGLSHWTAQLETGGASLVGIASLFVGSTEFQTRFPALDNAGFVTLLYGNVLGRAPDAQGMGHWKGLLDTGARSHAEVLVGFSESQEFTGSTAGRLSGGLWAADPEALVVLRMYETVLDRRPDANGLGHWTIKLDGGMPHQDLANGFIGSSEFQARYGGLDSRGFVERLYLNALDRPGDADGIAHWTGQLDAGAVSRPDVVSAFAFSHEMAIKLTPIASGGILFA